MILHSRYVYAPMLSLLLLIFVTGTLRASDSTFEIVSVSGASIPMGGVEGAVVSANGRYIAFSSGSRLTVGDDFDIDAYVYDRHTGLVTLLTGRQNGLVEGRMQDTFSTPGRRNPTISGDGRYVAFQSILYDPVSHKEGPMGIYVVDREMGQAQLVSASNEGIAANQDSRNPSISEDGRYIVFESSATNLVPNPTQGQFNIYLHDRETRETSRIPFPGSGIRNHFNPSISANGKFITFVTRVLSILEIYVHDRDTQQTSRVSMTTTGELTASSLDPSISADGNFIAFTSSSDEIVPSDTNNFSDIFVHNRQTGQTSRVSISSEGEESEGASSQATISADGQYVTFLGYGTSKQCPGPNCGGVYVHNRLSGQTNLITTEGWLGQAEPHINANGNVIIFSSTAPLAPNDGNGGLDIFVRDLQAGTTVIASVANPGVETVGYLRDFSVSEDGRFVAFEGDGTNLVFNDTQYTDILLRDRYLQQTSRVSISSMGILANQSSQDPAISGNGQIIAFSSYADNLVSGDTNGVQDIFVHDTYTEQTTRVSVFSNGEQFSEQSYLPSISADGQIIAFLSIDDFNDITIYIHDRDTGQTTNLGSVVDLDGYSRSPMLSANGQFVVFTDYVTFNSGIGIGVYIYDRETKQRELIISDGYQPAISANGRFVTFVSGADNLVLNDFNLYEDIFVYDRETKETTRVSISSNGIEADNDSFHPSLSGDGRFVTFASLALNLTEGYETYGGNIFIHDRDSGQTVRITNVPDTDDQGYPGGWNPIISQDSQSIIFRSTFPLLLDYPYLPDQIIATFNPLSGSPSNATPQINAYNSLPITLTWSGVTWAAEYQIRVDETEDFTSALAYDATTSALEVTITNLPENEQYFWQVRGIDADNNAGSWSDVQTFTLAEEE